MRRIACPLTIGAILILGSVGVSAAQSAAAPPAKQTGVAILDFSYVDTSGEVQDKSAEHQKWLTALAQGLKADLARDGGYRIVTPVCRPDPCAVGSTPPMELLSAAKEAGAQLLVVGGVHKMSTLIQWAKVTGVTVDDNRVVLDRLFTFRGDSEEAWARAEKFIARDLLAAALPSGAGNP
jgi:Protein of unknown function (DUF2380)